MLERLGINAKEAEKTLMVASSEKKNQALKKIAEGLIENTDKIIEANKVDLENGEKTEFLNTRIPVEDKPIYLRLYIEGRKSWFEWSYDGENYQKIGRIFDTTRFSDEYCKYGEFTGTMVGITCADRVLHKKCADFDFFEYKADEIILKEIWTENGYD